MKLNWNMALISTYFISTANGHRLDTALAQFCKSSRSYLRSILLIYLKESNS